MPDRLAHAVTRAKERYGLNLNMIDLAAIARQCREGYGFLMRSYDHKRHIYPTYILPYQGRRMIVVLSPDLSIVVTFQPPDYCRGGEQVKRAIRHRGQGKGSGASARTQRERDKAPSLSDWE